MTSRFFQPSIPHIPARYPLPWPRKVKPKEDFLLSIESKSKGLAKLQFGQKRCISYVKFHYVSAVWFSLTLQATSNLSGHSESWTLKQRKLLSRCLAAFLEFLAAYFYIHSHKDRLHSDAAPFVSKLVGSIHIIT